MRIAAVSRDQNASVEATQAGPVMVCGEHGEFFSIADLANEFGITPRAIRFYEDHGLIAPMRRGSSRIYARRDRARRAWVLRGKRVGFSLADIKELLDLYDADDGRATQRIRTREKCRDRIAALKAQRDDIDQMINELNLFDTTISQLLAQETDDICI